MPRTVRRKLMVISATLFLLFGAATVKAQNFPVRASVTIVNPSPYLEDYGRDGNTIIILTLVDNRPSYQGLLRLSIIGQGFEATTNEATFLGRPITLTRGVPIILRGPELAPYFDLNNLNIEGLVIDNTIDNGGRIPDGPITITAEFFDINRFDEPAVSNLGLSTRFVQQNYPPELVAPLGEIPGQPVPIINFSWNPRHIPQPANDEYVLQVWEKVPGLTDDQIANSRGFQRRPIITRIPRYTYTNADSRMEIGKSYLWRVQVRDQRNVRRFVNNGYSEYGTFVYGLEDDPGGDDCLGPTGLSVTNIGETSADLNWTFPSGEAQDNLTISTRITGQSTWQEAGTVPGNVSNYSLQGLTLATGYEVKVCTTCKSGEEDPCTALAFVTPTPDCGPLPQPITYAVTNSTILVTWENILQAEGYLLNWRKIPNPGDPVEAQEVPVGVAVGGDTPSTAPSNNPGTSAPPPNTLILPAGTVEGTATGLAAGWNYAFKLCKDCPDGTQECVEWVEVFNGAIDYCSDDYAPYLTVVYGSETQTTLDLGWTLAAAPSLPQGYSQTLTYFPTTVLGTTDTVTLSNNQLSTSIEGLEVATEYTAKICVLCPDGNKICSTVNGTTLPYACPDEFELESGVVVTPVIPDGIKVDWTLFGTSTTTEGWSFALLSMAGDTLQRATAEEGYTHIFTGLTAETEYRVAYCHECEDGTQYCAEETVYLTGCDAAELTLETDMIHFDFVELNWQDAGAEKYTVTFSEQGSSTSIGDPQTTENTDFTLGGLSPLTSYDISVCFECGSTPVCDTIVVTTIGVNCALAGDYEYDFECGLNVSLQDPENQQLVETLHPGDSIWAGDFLVEIAEITGSTTFGGFGHTKIPYLAGAKLQLDFHEIQVNEDCRMVAGKMVIKSPLEAALEQLQQGLLDLQDLLGDIDLFLGNLSAGLGSVTSMLNELATAADVTDEANAVLDQLVTALDQVPYLPDSYVDAVETAAECLRQAALTGTDDDVRDCRDQLLEAIQNAQDYIDDLFDADFIVDFSPTVPANVYWGLDSQRYDLITESYDQRTIGGTPYKVPWASTSTDEPSGVPFGAVRRDGETMNPVNFIGSDTQPYPGWTKEGTSASNPGLYADGDQQVKVVFAAHDNPDAEEGNDSIPPVKLAGQLNVVTYTPVQQTVHIIPVNGAALTQDASAVELAVNRIFRPSVAEWSVSIEPELTVPEFDGQLSDIPESLLSNYTPEMNLLKGKVKDQGYYDGDHYYLIVVPSMQEPGRLGFMPRKRSFGFLSAAQLSDATTFNRTVAHELAHGAFHLQHVYDRFDGLNPGATDNLMDTGNGEELYKYQWDNVHDPESNFTLFDDEDEGESVVVVEDQDFIDNIDDNPAGDNEDCISDPPIKLLDTGIFLAPSGVPFTLPAGTYVTFYKKGSTAKQKVVEGMVKSFALPGSSPSQRYVAHFFTDVITEYEGFFSGYVIPESENSKSAKLAAYYQNDIDPLIFEPSSLTGQSFPIKIGINKGCDEGSEDLNGLGYLYDYDYSGYFQDLSASPQWDVASYGKVNRGVGPVVASSVAFGTTYTEASDAEYNAILSNPSVSNLTSRTCTQDVQVDPQSIDDIEGFTVDATPDYIFDLSDPNTLTTDPTNKYYVTKFEKFEYDDGTQGYMGWLQIEGEKRQVAVYHYLNETNFFVWYDECGWVQGELVDQEEIPFIDALLGTFGEILTDPMTYVTVGAIVVGVVVSVAVAPVVIGYLGVTGAAAIATEIALDVVIVGGLEALAVYAITDDAEKAKQTMKWAFIGGAAGSIIGPIFRKIKLLKQAIRGGTEAAETLGKKADDLAKVVIEMKRADGTVVKVKPKQLADDAEALFTGDLANKSDKFLDELFEGSDEFRLFFGDAGEDFASRVHAWEARHIANVSSTIDELSVLSKYLKNNPNAVIDDIGQAIAARESIDKWVDATIEAAGNRTQLKNILDDFGYTNCKTAVGDASNVQANNLAGLDNGGDPALPTATADYSQYASARGSQYAKQVGESFEDYFQRLKNSGDFNQFESHHLFPVELFKNKGFRTWYETLGNTTFAMNGKNAAGAANLENLMMLEKFTNAVGGVHANHPFYNTTIIDYFTSRWTTHMGTTGNNATAASALFNADISVLSANLKQAIKDNSILGTHKVNDLFKGPNPIVDFNSLTP